MFRSQRWQTFLLFSLAAYLLLNAAIFAVSVLVSPPHWNTSGVYQELLSATRADGEYRKEMARIFTVLVAATLPAALLSKLSHRRHLAILLFSTAIFSSLFTYFSTRGRQWYFEFGTSAAWSSYGLLTASILFGGAAAWIIRACRMKAGLSRA
jgi:hypothetical protein